MKKKLFVMVLALALLATAEPARAAESGTLAGGEAVVGVPGGQVLFPIYVSGGMDFAACKLYIQCDTTVFSLEQNRAGDYQVRPGDVTGQGTWGANTYGANGWQINWYRERNVKGEGVLCYLPLEIDPSAPYGIYEIQLLCSAENTVDQEGREVPFSTVNGTIEIATSTPTLHIGDRPLVSGAVVDLPIYIRNNPGLVGIHLKIESNEQIEVVLDNEGKPIVMRKNVLATGNFLVNSYGDKGGQAMWYNTTAVKEDGLLCTIRVRILAKPGQEIAIALDYQAANTLNAQNEPQGLDLAVTCMVADAVPPELVASWTENGLRVSGVLGPSLELNQIQPILAFYRNGQMLQAVTEFDADEQGEIAIDLPLPAPRSDNRDRLSLFCLDRASLTPSLEHIDIVIN